jgi:predicted permease
MFKRQWRTYLWMIRVVSLLVPKRFRTGWRQEWEAELLHREEVITRWQKSNAKVGFDLLKHSSGSFWDALWLQPIRLEEDMFQDLKYGARMLFKYRGFSAVVIITLALGIGANTAIFSVVNAVLLKSLPVHEPERLVLFGKGESSGRTDSFPNESWDLFSYPFYREVQQRHELFSDVAALLSIPWNVHGTINGTDSPGEIEQLDVQLVSGNYFSALGVKAGFGRMFTEADDQTPGGHPVAVVSHAWWERRLGGDPSAVGKTITIDQTVYTIVGVAPEEFFGTTVGQAPDLWVPLAMEAQMPPAHWNGRDKKLDQTLYLIARLRNGVSAIQASAAVNVLFKQFLEGQAATAEQLQDIQRASIELTPAGQGLSSLRREFSLSLRILMAVVGVVLLIACANVANLLLARAAARQKEFAVRMAIGAGRIRLVRQLLTESVLLASLGGIAGILLAWWGSRMLIVMVSSGSKPLPLDVTPNVRILGFTILASLLSAVIFGTAPALRATRIEPNSVLKSGAGAMQAMSQSPLGKALVVAQVALSLLLLVGAGLFMRTLINLQNVPTGYNQQNVMLFHMDTSTTGLKDAYLSQMLHEVEEKVKAVPGVQAASFSFFTFNQGAWTSVILTRDQTPPQGDSRVVRQNVVGQDYFTAMGIPLVFGRGFGAQDSEKSVKVAIISKTMAQRFFPNSSPIGKRFGTDGPEEYEIIGVAADARYESLTEQLKAMVYYPHAQHPRPLNNFAVRFSGAPEIVVPQVRQAVKQVNSNLPIDEVVSLSDHIGRSLVQQKLVQRLASFFGLLALLLASVGLYGVLSYTVAQRTNELGIRIALGAQSGHVLWLVMRGGLTLVLIGVVIGLLASLVTTRTASTLLFGLKPNDPLTIALATLLLMVVAFVACWIPALRATKVNPLRAIRYE